MVQRMGVSKEETQRKNASQGRHRERNNTRRDCVTSVQDLEGMSGQLPVFDVQCEQSCEFVSEGRLSLRVG